MKRKFLWLIFMAGFATTLTAQVDKKAIGVRFGGFLGYGGEISYQHPIGRVNRLELDLGLVHSNVGLTGVYQWVKPLPELYDGFSWYYGVGASVGAYSDEFGLGVVGQLGLQYNFDFPLQLSLDYRPGLYLIPLFTGSYDGICLAARYCF